MPFVVLGVSIFYASPHPLLYTPPGGSGVERGPGVTQVDPRFSSSHPRGTWPLSSSRLDEKVGHWPPVLRPPLYFRLFVPVQTVRPEVPWGENGS